jgi:hypothetical protein
MASETIKTLLMMGLFGLLEALLYFPRLHTSARRQRFAVIPLRPEASTSHMLQAVRVRHGLRRR